MRLIGDISTKGAHHCFICREHSARGQLSDVQPFGGDQARGWSRKVTLKKMGARSCIAAAATKGKQIEETFAQVMARKRSKVADDCSGVTTRSARAKQQMKLRSRSLRK